MGANDCNSQSFIEIVYIATVENESTEEEENTLQRKTNQSERPSIPASQEVQQSIPQLQFQQPLLQQSQLPQLPQIQPQTELQKQPQQLQPQQLQPQQRPSQPQPLQILAAQQTSTPFHSHQLIQQPFSAVPTSQHAHQSSIQPFLQASAFPQNSPHFQSQQTLSSFPSAPSLPPPSPSASLPHAQPLQLSLPAVTSLQRLQHQPLQMQYQQAEV